MEFLAYVNDVRDYIKKIIDRNEINYNKAFSIMNQYKKDMESSQINLINNNNINNINSQNQDKTTLKKNYLNISGNYLQNSAPNIPGGKTTPKYSSNILNKKDNFFNNNNNKSLDVNSADNHNQYNNQNQINNNNNNQNTDGKPISIKFINNNIHHYVINNQNQNHGQTPIANLNQKNNLNSPSNNNNNLQDKDNNYNYQNNNLNKPKEQKPDKKNKKINAFRNVAKPQTAMGTINASNFNSNKDVRTNNIKIPGRENIKMQENNINNNNNLDNYNYINKTPNTPHNKNLFKNSYDNIINNYSQQMQPGMLNKFNIKQISINSNDKSPINRATRGSLSLHSTINKNNNNNIQYSRPSSNNDKKQQQLNRDRERDRSNNSNKDNININYNNNNNNNPTIIASIKRTPSSNSLVKSLTRNYSKQIVGNENNINNNNNSINQQRVFLNMNRQTPKNYSSNSLDLKNGEFIRNSYTGLNLNMVSGNNNNSNSGIGIGISSGIEKKQSNQKYLNANNLNIKSPTLNR